MRFDDTNPAKENTEFEKIILEDLKLLNVNYNINTFTSDHFGDILNYADQLINKVVWHVVWWYITWYDGISRDMMIYITWYDEIYHVIWWYITWYDDISRGMINDDISRGMMIFHVAYWYIWWYDGISRGMMRYHVIYCYVTYRVGQKNCTQNQFIIFCLNIVETQWNSQVTTNTLINKKFKVSSVIALVSLSISHLWLPESVGYSVIYPVFQITS